MQRIDDMLYEFGHYYFGVSHSQEITFKLGIVHLPVQLYVGFRDDKWKMHKNVPEGRRYARRRWRQRMEKSLGRCVSLQHEELNIMGWDAIMN